MQSLQHQPVAAEPTDDVSVGRIGVAHVTLHEGDARLLRLRGRACDEAIRA